MTRDEALRRAAEIASLHLHHKNKCVWWGNGKPDGPCNCGTSRLQAELAEEIRDALLSASQAGEQRGREGEREASDQRLVGCMCPCHNGFNFKEPHGTCVDCQMHMIERADRAARDEVYRQWLGR